MTEREKREEYEYELAKRLHMRAVNRMARSAMLARRLAAMEETDPLRKKPGRPRKAQG